MTLLLEFSQDYPLLRTYVSSMYAPSSPLQEWGNEDIVVRLRDGRELAFTVFSLPNIQELMIQNAQDTFISPGMLIVSRVTWKAIFDAIEECLKLSVGGNYSLEHFGVLQTPDV